MVPPFPAAAYGADAAGCYLPADVSLSLRAEFHALGGSDRNCRRVRYDVSLWVKAKASRWVGPLCYLNTPRRVAGVICQERRQLRCLLDTSISSFEHIFI